MRKALALLLLAGLVAAWFFFSQSSPVEVKPQERLGKVHKPSIHVTPEKAAAEREGIPIEVLEPEERTWPVTSFPVTVGVVFPEGERVSPVVGRFENDLGDEVPFEF